ncbi:MAG: prepilin-type N-terminal cleavage/methylation domain-containing protein [Akkermansiaceae bacterium]|nr:prepilin-type N-terminal cleavage/methylation domain-containing protein [Akkermansiaceae bacterium]
MKQTQKHLGNHGFTLVELMVTMAILTIILGMALQLTESARTSIRISENSTANDSIARKAFDLISRDISQMINREDVPIEFESKSGDDELLFLASIRGLTDDTEIGERPASLVTYKLSFDETFGPQLLRGMRGHQFDDSSDSALNLNPETNLPEIPTDNLQRISNGIIRMEVEYLVKKQSLVNNEDEDTVNEEITREIEAPELINELKGLVVTIVTLDERARRGIPTNRLPSLADRFDDAKPPKILSKSGLGSVTRSPRTKH